MKPKIEVMGPPPTSGTRDAFVELAMEGGAKQVPMLAKLKKSDKQRFKQIPGVEVMESSPTFNEFTVRLPMDAGEPAGMLVERGIAPGLPLGPFYPGLERYLLVAVTEKRTKHEIGRFAEELEAVLCRLGHARRDRA